MSTDVYGARLREGLQDLRPGIVDWAELNCGSDEDELGARENLQYDLYYLKNHTLLLDLAILVHAAQMLVLKGS